jgi:NTP pyrophosphatase (non-canonical NTP hydrolase)
LDEKATVSALKEKVTEFRDERDWLKFHNPKDLSIALSVESAELQELFLWKEDPSAEKVQANAKLMGRIKEEMADVGIYLLSLADVLSIDVSDAVIEKLAQNASKYPVDKSKGSSKKYKELWP